MKISIEREPLVDALGRMVPIASNKSPLSILANVYLRTGDAESEDSITLDVSDLGTAMKIRLMSCQVTEPGSICLDAKKLFEITKTMSGELVDITSNEQSRATITSGNSTFNLEGLDGKGFPIWDVGDSDLTITVPKLTLASAIQKTVFAASTDDSRFNLNATLWEIQDGSMKFVATDGHRLALAFEVALVLNDDMRLMVPKKSMMAIKKFIDKTTNPVEVQIGKKHITISSDNSTLRCRLIDGDYPDYTKVVPSSAGQVATIDRVGLLRSLSMVRLMTSDRNRGVELVLGNDTLGISSKHPEMGTAQDSMPVQYEGPPLEILANVEYLIEGLNVIESEIVRLEYFKDGAPILFRPVGADNYFNLVMPMRK